MSDVLLELVTAVIGALVGAWAGALFEGRRGAAPAVDNTGGAVQGDVTVDAKFTRATVINIWRRPAEATPRASARGADGEGEDNPWLVIGSLLVAMVALALLYVAVREIALEIFGYVAFGLIGFGVGLVGWVLSRRKIDWFSVIGLGVVLLCAGAAVINGRWLSNDYLFSDRLGLVLDRDTALRLDNFGDFLTAEEVTVLAVQGIGLALTGAVLICGACILGWLFLREWMGKVRLGGLRLLSLATSFLLFILLSIATSSAQLLALPGGLAALFGEDPGVTVTATTRRSPGAKSGSLLCARVGGSAGAPGMELSVQLKKRGNGGRRRWNQVESVPVSGNNTACLTVSSRDKSALYRFVLVGSSPPARSHAVGPFVG